MEDVEEHDDLSRHFTPAILRGFQIGAGNNGGGAGRHAIRADHEAWVVRFTEPKALAPTDLAVLDDCLRRH